MTYYPHLSYCRNIWVINQTYRFLLLIVHIIHSSLLHMNSVRYYNKSLFKLFTWSQLKSSSHIYYTHHISQMRRLCARYVDPHNIILGAAMQKLIMNDQEKENMARSAKPKFMYRRTRVYRITIFCNIFLLKGGQSLPPTNSSLLINNNEIACCQHLDRSSGRSSISVACPCLFNSLQIHYWKAWSILITHPIFYNSVHPAFLMHCRKSENIGALEDDRYYGHSQFMMAVICHTNSTRDRVQTANVVDLFHHEHK